jgi:hypothetical protein
MTLSDSSAFSRKLPCLSLISVVVYLNRIGKYNIDFGLKAISAKPRPGACVQLQIRLSATVLQTSPASLYEGVFRLVTYPLDRLLDTKRRWFKVCRDILPDVEIRVFRLLPETVEGCESRR